MASDRLGSRELRLCAGCANDAAGGADTANIMITQVIYGDIGGYKGTEMATATLPRV